MMPNKLRDTFASSLLLCVSGLYAQGIEFDGTGNMITDGQKSLTYNSQNKLIAADSPLGTGHYVYKDSGSRLRKRFSLTSSPGQTTELLNPTRLMTQQAKHGARRRLVNHIYVNGMRLAALGPDAAGNPAIRYYHTDQVSSVKLVTDGKADVVQRHEYLPYGEDFLLPSPRQWGGAGGGAPKFNSQEHDKESGLDFFNARHYDSKLAHFTSADTIIDGEATAAGWNRYIYVHGNPVRYGDPGGNQIDDAILDRAEYQDLKNSETFMRMFNTVKTSYTLELKGLGGATNAENQTIRSGKSMAGDTSQTPQTILAHEITHAFLSTVNQAYLELYTLNVELYRERSDNHSQKPGDKPPRGLLKLEALLEVGAILGENMVRNDLGLKLRKYYFLLGTGPTFKMDALDESRIPYYKNHPNFEWTEYDDELVKTWEGALQGNDLRESIGINRNNFPVIWPEATPAEITIAPAPTKSCCNKCCIL